MARDLHNLLVFMKEGRVRYAELLERNQCDFCCFERNGRYPREQAVFAAVLEGNWLRLRSVRAPAHLVDGCSVQRGGRAFSLQLPAAFVKKPLQGMDSEVGRWKVASMSMDCDYGSYSWPLEPNDAWREHRVCEVKIGGRVARVVRAPTQSEEYFSGAQTCAEADERALDARILFDSLAA